jgi:outer membrane protein OmpA-like peptidoglycan-associated protein
MKTTSKLVVGMTVAMFTMHTWASIAMANSQVWTTTNGSAVVDGSGNLVRTIHYIDKNLVVTKVAPKAFSSLLAVVQNVVIKVFNTEIEPERHLELKSEPKRLILAEENTSLLPKTPTPEPTPAVVEPEEIVVLEPVVKPVVIGVVAEEPKPEPKPEPEPKLETAAVVTPVIPDKIVYSFNNYKATILFDTDSAVITADASGSLTQLAMAAQKAEKVMSVKLVGYADSRGKYNYNMALSEKRMTSVANFLDELKLKVTSRFAKGDTAPVLETDGENLAMSRRVEVQIKTRHID